MNRFEIFALLAAIGATILVLMGIGTPGYAYYLSQIRSGGMPAWIAGTILLTYGPLVLAVCFWRWSARLRLGWVLHLLLLPGILALFRAGDALMLSVIQDPDFDAMMGGPELPGMLLLPVVVIAYCVALVVRIGMPQNRTEAP